MDWLKTLFQKQSKFSSEDSHLDLRTGSDAEDFAVRYLSKKSFDILERNYSIPSGEIDIIAKINEVVVFIEIKYLSGRNRSYFPEEQVTESKQKKIAKAASSYMQKYPSIQAVRFDVIAIESNGNSGLDIRHYENAFEID